MHLFFLRKHIAAKVGILWGKTIQKWISASKSFIKISFYTNQVHFKIWCVVKLFFRKLTQSKTFDSNFFELWKNGSKYDAFENLDSKYDALYNKFLKNWMSLKILIQIFLKKKKKLFLEYLFLECTKKPILTFLWCKLTR